MSSQKTTKTQRFHLLRQALLTNPMSLQELLDVYQAHGTSRSLRQMQRDLKELEQHGVATESLYAFFVGKTKYYQLEKASEKERPQSLVHESIRPTNFYKPVITLHDEQKIALIQKAIANGERIGVSKIINDETGDNAQFETKQVELVPIELLLHRNNYYVGSYHLKRECVVFFNIKQMVSVFLPEKKGTPERYWEAYTQEVNKRFGVTKNIDARCTK